MTRGSPWKKQLWFGIVSGLFVGTTLIYMYSYTSISAQHISGSDLYNRNLKLANFLDIEATKTSKVLHAQNNDQAKEKGEESKQESSAGIKTSSRTSTTAVVTIPVPVLYVPTPLPVVPTTVPSGPVFIPNIGKCDGCLAGRQLITLHTAWICGQSRFGNKMFMMASVIAAAASWKNVTFVLPQREKECADWIDSLSDLFVSINKTIPRLPGYLMQNWTAYGEPGSSVYSPLQWHDHNFTIAGYRQSWRYFEGNRKTRAVRKAFKFNSKYEIAAANAINAASLKFNFTTPIFVGVHMRIGDLREQQRLDYGYQMANESFYINALDAVKTHFNQSKSLIFLVASDTPEEAKKMLSSVESLYSIEWLHGSAFEDFTTLSKCNHSIISGGTYGFWTAWLAGGETFYFSNFAKPGSSFGKGFNGSNFYLPSWKPVGWTKYIT